MTLFLCSDVDGTIIDSRALVRRAYAEVGVDMPDDAWGRPWNEWLIELVGSARGADLIHNAKIYAYERLLHRADIGELELPAAAVVRDVLSCFGPRSVQYLTAGTYLTARTAVDRLDVDAPVFGSLTYDGRLAHLLDVPHGTIYLDDDATTIERLRDDAPHLRLVHVSGQSVDELLIEIARLRRRE